MFAGSCGSHKSKEKTNITIHYLATFCGKNTDKIKFNNKML